MSNADELIGNPKNTPSKFCLAKIDDIYLVYLPKGGSTQIDLQKASGKFSIQWFNPRKGGKLRSGSKASLSGGTTSDIGQAPEQADQDWLAVIRKMK